MATPFRSGPPSPASPPSAAFDMAELSAELGYVPFDPELDVRVSYDLERDARRGDGAAFEALLDLARAGSVSASERLNDFGFDLAAAQAYELSNALGAEDVSEAFADFVQIVAVAKEAANWPLLVVAWNRMAHALAGDFDERNKRYKKLGAEGTETLSVWMVYYDRAADHEYGRHHYWEPGEQDFINECALLCELIRIGLSQRLSRREFDDASGAFRTLLPNTPQGVIQVLWEMDKRAAEIGASRFAITHAHRLATPPVSPPRASAAGVVVEDLSVVTPRRALREAAAEASPARPPSPPFSPRQLLREVHDGRHTNIVAKSTRRPHERQVPKRSVKLHVPVTNKRASDIAKAAADARRERGLAAKPETSGYHNVPSTSARAVHRRMRRAQNNLQAQQHFVERVVAQADDLMSGEAMLCHRDEVFRSPCMKDRAK